jgi:hypothetical protein
MKIDYLLYILRYLKPNMDQEPYDFPVIPCDEGDTKDLDPSSAQSLLPTKKQQYDQDVANREKARELWERLFEARRKRDEILRKYGKYLFNEIALTEYFIDKLQEIKRSLIGNPFDWDISRFNLEIKLIKEKLYEKQFYLVNLAEKMDGLKNKPWFVEIQKDANEVFKSAQDAYRAHFAEVAAQKADRDAAKAAQKARAEENRKAYLALKK